MENKEYIQKWLAGTLTESERQAFEKTPDYEALKKLDRHLKYFKAPDYDAKAEYATLSQNIAPKPAAKVVQVNWAPAWLKIAAAILVVAVVGYLLYNNEATTHIRAAMASHTEFYLPDSSRVVLNAQSHIAYQARSWKEDRELQMDGEAYFEVAKGSEFEVNTPQGTVTVLGTKFNVLSRNNYFEVVCYEGKVKVVYNQEATYLTPGKMLRAINGKVALRPLEGVAKPAWIKHESAFTSVPYNYVLAELERQYDIRIKANNIDTTTLFTGSFVHNDLNLALKAVALPLNLQYTIRGNEIFLTGSDK